jgi:pseudaminic acid biosynthesis-associated methylase
MSDNYQTEQEAFWAGDFGNAYADRNDGVQLIADNLSFFNKVLAQADPIKSLIEFGSNIGLNLQTLNLMFPDVEKKAVEINKYAAEKLKEIQNTEVFNGSIFDYEIDKTYDLSFTRGVLIHLNPDKLDLVYEKLYQSSHKYIVVAEYYSKNPISLKYHNEENKLFLRDFAGEIMDKYNDLKLIDYGFVYYRDRKYPHDDITWFLMEKTK